MTKALHQFNQGEQPAIGGGKQESVSSSSKQLSRQVEEFRLGSNASSSDRPEKPSSTLPPKQKVKMFSQLTPVQKLMVKQEQLHRIEDQAFDPKDDLPIRLKQGLKKFQYKKKILLQESVARAKSPLIRAMPKLCIPAFSQSPQRQQEQPFVKESSKVSKLREEILLSKIN